jgi:hypothetical protein
MFPAWLIPAIFSGASAVGNVLGARAQQGGLSQAQGYLQQGTQQAADAILGMYDVGRADMAPFRGLAGPSVNRLQQLAWGNIPVPAQETQNQPVQRSAFAQQFGGRPQDTGLGAVMGTTEGGQPAPGPRNERGRNALLGGSIGAGVGSGLGMLGGLGAGSALGLGALGGPIGLGIAGAGVLLGSIFNNNNPDKDQARRGIEEISKRTWGTTQPGVPVGQLQSGLIADVRNGRLDPDQADAQFRGWWDEWVRGMQTAGLDKGIIQSSVDTQRRHFQPVKDAIAQARAMRGQPQAQPMNQFAGQAQAPQQPAVNRNALLGRM